jgi:anti-sigma factor RsiW
MNCKAVQHRMSAYLDGELSGFEMLEIRSHLGCCPNCKEESEDLRKLKWLMQCLPDNEPAPDFAARLKDNVLTSGTFQRRRLPIAMISGLAFAAALLATLVAIHRTQLHPQVAMPTHSAPTQTNFELARDQAYQSGGDFFSDGSMVMTASAPSYGNR